MKFKKKFVALALSSLVLGGCLSDDNNAPVTAPTALNDQGVLITASGATITIDNTTGEVLSRSTITGLGAGETIVDADYRNADGRLWVLTSASKLYSVEESTNVATERSTLSIALTTGETYAVDFNPVVDRLRVIGGNGTNWAVNVESGAVGEDTDTSGPVGPPPFEVTHSAYTDTFSAMGRGTLLFNLDETNNVLYGQNPAGSGVQTLQSPLGVDPTDIIGFDLPADTRTGLAPMVVGGELAMYRIDTEATSGAATKVGNITLNAGETPVAFAQKKRANPTVVGLTESQQFFTFRYLQPTIISDLSTAFMLGMGEELLGMDYNTNTANMDRPQSLYVLTTTNAYRTNNSTSPSSLTNARPLVAVMGTGTALSSSADYSIDFNPTSGGLRVVGSDKSNRAIGIGAMNANITDEANIEPERDLIAHAYVNSVPGASTTRLLAVDAAGREFVQQAVPAATATSLNVISFAVARDTAFDIRYPGDAVVLFASKAASGDRTTLYSASAISGGGINVGNAIGQIGGATGPTDILDLAIGQ